MEKNYCLHKDSCQWRTYDMLKKGNVATHVSFDHYRIFCDLGVFAVDSFKASLDAHMSNEYLKNLQKTSCKNDFQDETNEKKAFSKFYILTLIKQLKKLFIKYLKCLIQYELDEYKIDIESGHLFFAANRNLRCECGLFELKKTKTDI